jgi:hypothetical protein
MTSGGNTVQYTLYQIKTQGKTMSAKRRLRFLTALTLNTAAIDAASAYTTVGTWFTQRLESVTFTNTSNVDIWVSFDGTNNHVFVPAGAARSLNGSLLECFISADELPEFKKDTGTASSGQLVIDAQYA